MRAIETLYKGYRFRSRLEARWAVFFDALKIEYQYEPEGFVLSDGSLYLPDFYLPVFSGGCYVEVKPTGGDFSKARLLHLDSKKDVWLAEGPPDFKATWCWRWLDGEPDLIDVVPMYDEAEREKRFFTCPGNLDENNRFEDPGPHTIYHRAIHAARSARFEHGETPYA